MERSCNVITVTCFVPLHLSPTFVKFGFSRNILLISYIAGSAASDVSGESSLKWQNNNYSDEMSLPNIIVSLIFSTPVCTFIKFDWVKQGWWKTIIHEDIFLWFIRRWRLFLLLRSSELGNKNILDFVKHFIYDLHQVVPDLPVLLLQLLRWNFPKSLKFRDSKLHFSHHNSPLP